MSSSDSVDSDLLLTRGFSQTTVKVLAGFREKRGEVMHFWTAKLGDKSRNYVGRATVECYFEGRQQRTAGIASQVKLSIILTQAFDRWKNGKSEKRKIDGVNDGWNQAEAEPIEPIEPNERQLQ